MKYIRCISSLLIMAAMICLLPIISNSVLAHPALTDLELHGVSAKNHLFQRNKATSSEAGSPDQVIDYKNYQWCKLSELNPENGYTAVEFTFYESICPLDFCPQPYKGQVGRFKYGIEDLPDELSLTFSSSESLWCTDANVGCIPSKDLPDLEVLCDTPDVVHTLAVVEDTSLLPQFGVLSLYDFFPNASLCASSYKNDAILGITWSPIDDQAEESDASTQCPAVITSVYSGLSIDTLGLLQLSPPDTYLIAENRAEAQTRHPKCLASSQYWTDAEDNPEPVGPVNSSDVFSLYPVDEVRICQAFIEGTGRKLVGIEFPQLQYTFSTGSSQSTAQTLPGGCQLINDLSSTPTSQPIASNPSDNGYERIGLSTHENWHSADTFNALFSTGCISYKNEIKSYNICRFTRDDNTEIKIYGRLIEGEKECAGITPHFPEGELNLKYTVQKSSEFEIYTGIINESHRIVLTSDAPGKSMSIPMILLGIMVSAKL